MISVDINLIYSQLISLKPLGSFPSTYKQAEACGGGLLRKWGERGGGRAIALVRVSQCGCGLHIDTCSCSQGHCAQGALSQKTRGQLVKGEARAPLGGWWV